MSLVCYQEDEPLVGELQAPWSDAVAAIHAALAAVAALRAPQSDRAGPVH
jgi:hypothetical protein